MDKEKLKDIIIKLVNGIDLIDHSEKLSKFRTIIMYKNGSKIYIKNILYDTFSETTFDIKLYIETVNKNFLWFKFKVKRYENIDKNMLSILFPKKEYKDLETSVINSHYTHLKKLSEKAIDNLT